MVWMSLANFTCKFGPELNMKDRLDSVVLPAFLGPNMIRGFRDARLFLSDVSLKSMRVDDGEGGEHVAYCVVGRLIRDTILHREQVVRDGRIVHAPARMETAPSSRFYLFLNNHIVAYVHETRYAPDLDVFRSTMTRFIAKSYQQYINSQYDFYREYRPRITKKILRARTPGPNLRVTPLASRGSVSDFLGTLSVLKEIRIKFPWTNPELNNDGLFADIRRQGDALGSTATLIHKNSSGLNIDSSLPVLEATGRSGNNELTLTALDNSGNAVQAKNSDLQVRIPIDTDLLDLTTEHVAALATNATGYFRLSRNHAIEEAVERYFDQVNR